MSALVRIDEQVPSGDRMDFICDMAAGMWVPMDFSFNRPCERLDASVAGEFRASGLGPMQVVVMDIMPISVRRTEKHISQSAPELLKAYLVCEGGGPSVISQGGRQAVLDVGDLTFYDTRRPYEGVLGTDPVRPTRAMTFMFPPSLLPLPPSAISELTAVRIPATSGLGELTAQFLLQLARNVDSYSPVEAARLSTCALEVLATRLARELGVRHWESPEARRHAMLTTVQGFIAQNLGDPELSPAAVAAAHHMSLRSLHQLFHDEGLTVAGYIRARRLERCRRDLSDPALDSRPVAAVAARWGFSSAGDFSRAFRAAHGMPPAEYRKSARDVKGLAL